RFGKSYQLVSDSRAVITRITRAKPDARLLFNHNSLSVAHVAWPGSKLMPHALQSMLGVCREPVRLENQLVREPLVMNARGVDRLLNRHAIVDHVRYDL